MLLQYEGQARIYSQCRVGNNGKKLTAVFLQHGYSLTNPAGSEGGGYRRCVGEHDEGIGFQCVELCKVVVDDTDAFFLQRFRHTNIFYHGIQILFTVICGFVMPDLVLVSVPAGKATETLVKLQLTHVPANGVQNVAIAHGRPVHHAECLTADVRGESFRCGGVPLPDLGRGLLVSAHAVAFEPSSELLLRP